MPSHANPVNWFEIPVNDLSAARTFYESVLGIEITETDDLGTLVQTIFDKIEHYISPCFKFLNLQQMLEKGKDIDEIFDGPALEHGFIENETLVENSKRSARGEGCSGSQFTSSQDWGPGPRGSREATRPGGCGRLSSATPAGPCVQLGQRTEFLRLRPERDCL